MRKAIAAAVMGFLAAASWSTSELAVAQTIAETATAKTAGRSAGAHRMNGNALWYGGPRFNGRKTAGGAVFDENAMMAAHRTLAFGTKVRVTNLRNDRSAIVTINDRMARRRTVIIDVSRGVAAELDMLNAGRVPVRLEIVP